jgi:cob(I)alamin adenosyltransferase
MAEKKRMASIVTKTGDDGTTGLMYNRRVSKCHPRVEAYGAVDELNTALGLARATAPPFGLGAQLIAIQRELVILMGELATQPEDLPRYLQNGFSVVTGQMTARLEALVAGIESQNISCKGWATPGATVPAAALDLARTACRRAERRACALREAGELDNVEILVYLNRLSDALWLMARQAEQTAPASS